MNIRAETLLDPGKVQLFENELSSPNTSSSASLTVLLLR